MSPSDARTAPVSTFGPDAPAAGPAACRTTGATTAGTSAMAASAAAGRHAARRPWRQRAREFWPDVMAFLGALLFATSVAVLLGLIGGCGGGVGTEGTGTYSSGPITGFGSIVVNGVHFDESSASVSDADDGNLASSALALGMVVEVQAGSVSTDSNGRQRASATSVRAVRALRGPISQPIDASGRLAVVGQPVQVRSDTVIDSSISGGSAGLVAGVTVEVYGSFDAASGVWLATRIAATSSGDYCVRGTVSTVSASTFVLNGQTYSSAGLGSGETLQAGSSVRITLQAATDNQGRWVARGQSSGGSGSSGGDQDGVQLQGLIGTIVGTQWLVDGKVVNVASATISGGTARVGAQVQITGVLRSGVVAATQVQISGSSEPRTYEVEGAIVSRDASARTLVVRSEGSNGRLITVSYAGSVNYSGGASAAALATYTGRLNVQGVWSADAAVLIASRIEFDR